MMITEMRNKDTVVFASPSPAEGLLDLCNQRPPIVNVCMAGPNMMQREEGHLHTVFSTSLRNSASRRISEEEEKTTSVAGIAR